MALLPTIILHTWFELQQSFLVGTGAFRKEQYLGGKKNPEVQNEVGEVGQASSSGAHGR
jgi:hypothetical protein